MVRSNWVLAGAAALMCVAACDAHAAGWSGRVIDIRTGQPLAGIEVQGGWTGRVDVTDKVTTKQDGRFTVEYPKHDQAPEAYVLYAWPKITPDGNGFGMPGRMADYLCYEEHRKAPGEAEIRMVPLWGHIKGRVVDAESGRPLEGINVCLGQPGRYLVSGQAGYAEATTNARGEYAIRVAAYPDFFHLGVEGVADAHRSPKAESHGTPIVDYWVEANFGARGAGKDYQTISTSLKDGDGKQVHTPIPLLSSVPPTIYTEVSFRLPKKESAIKPSAELVAVIPPRLPGGGNQDVLRRIDALIRTAEQMLAELRDLRAAVAGQ